MGQRLSVTLARFKPKFETNAPRVFAINPVPWALVTALDAMRFEVIVYEEGRSNGLVDATRLIDECDAVVAPIPGDFLSAMLTGIALSRVKPVFALRLRPFNGRVDALFERIRIVNDVETLRRVLRDAHGTRVGPLSALSQFYEEKKKKGQLPLAALETLLEAEHLKRERGEE